MENNFLGIVKGEIRLYVPTQRVSSNGGQIPSSERVRIDHMQSSGRVCVVGLTGRLRGKKTTLAPKYLHKIEGEENNESTRNESRCMG